MQEFKQWLNESEETDVFGADAKYINSWLSQKYEPGPGNRPHIMFRGTDYQVIGEPDMPQARGSFVQVRPLNIRHRGADKLIPIKALLAAVVPS